MALPSAALVLAAAALGGCGSRSDGASSDRPDAQPSPQDAAPRVDSGPARADATADARGAPDATTQPDAPIQADAPTQADATTPQDAGAGDTNVEPPYHLLGRFSADDAGTGMRASWTGSGAYAKFTGTAIAADMASDVTSQYTVVIDGAPVATPLTVSSAGRATQTLASGLAPNVTHELVVFKRNEAEDGALVLYGLSPTGGALVPAPLPYAHRLEFIGDSITAGYGNLGLSNCGNAETTDEDGYESYASIAARQLNAELHTVAYSGRGAYRDYAGQTTSDAQMLTWYQAATTAPGDGGTVPDVPWDFTQWTADAVFINLGTNDFAAGDPGPPFVDAMVTLLQFVRAKYPAVPIFLGLSPMLVDPSRTTCQGYLQTAIAMLQTSPSDTSLQLVSFPPLTDGTSLCEGHPSLTDDASMAALVSQSIATALGWAVDLSAQ